MRRSLIALVLATLACQKATPPAPPPEAPADVIATVSVAHPGAWATRLGAYVDKVAPGMGSQVDGKKLAMGLAAMLEAQSLDSLDLTQPVRVVIFDPKAHAHPFLVLATFTDAEALRRGADKLKIERDGGVSLVGPEAEVAAAKTWAFGALAKQAAPEAPTAEVWVKRVMDKYRADLEAFPAKMAEAGLAGPMQGVITGELRAFIAVGEQSERAFFSLDASGDEASVDIALAPLAGAPFAAFVKGQKPFEQKLLSLLTLPERPSMIMVGHMELRELGEPVYAIVAPLLASVTGRPADEALHKDWAAWLAHFTGDMAAVNWSEPGGGMDMVELVGVDDGEAAQTATETFLGSALTAGARKVSFMNFDMEMSSAVKPKSASGLTVHTFGIKWDLSKLMPLQAEMMKKMYPDGMKMAFAGFGKTFGVTLGPKSEEMLAALADATTARGHLPAFAQSTLDAAAKRGESFVMIMNLAALMNPFGAANAPAAQSGMVWSMGFSDGRARLRMALPAAHITEIMAAMQGMKAPQ
jgi:hypothetical protein